MTKLIKKVYSKPTLVKLERLLGAPVPVSEAAR